MNFAQSLSQGFITAAVEQALDNGEISKQLSCLDTRIQTIGESLKPAQHYYEQMNLPDVVQTITVPIITDSPLKISNYDRTYAIIFVPPGSEAITIKMSGLSPSSVQFRTGWNTIIIPRGGLELWMTAASGPVNMLLRCSNHPLNAMIEKSWTPLYNTTQVGVSTWSGSGDISGLSNFTELYISANVSALTGTSIQFQVKRKDMFGNYIFLSQATALTSPGSSEFAIGRGMQIAKPFGSTILITAVLTAITSVSFTIDVQGR